MFKEPVIQTILQAHGQEAEYEDGSRRPVLCWALLAIFSELNAVRQTYISGMVLDEGEIINAEEVSGFMRYKEADPPQ